VNRRLWFIHLVDRTHRIVVRDVPLHQGFPDERLFPCGAVVIPRQLSQVLPITRHGVAFEGCIDPWTIGGIQFRLTGIPVKISVGGTWYLLPLTSILSGSKASKATKKFLGAVTGYRAGRLPQLP
jgi:hypothetical protein